MSVETQILDLYVLHRKISQGGFGEVWEARSLENPKERYVIKLLQLPENFALLKREYEILQRVYHPQICRPIEAHLDEDPPYVVLEYVEGLTLRQYLQKYGPLPMNKVVDVLCQLVDILEYLHKKGIVHADLKPENIILEPNGKVKLLDFGLALYQESVENQVLLSGVLESSLKEGNIAGTLYYMSPEQRKGGEIDSRADIYALGILCFELLVGELPELGDVPTKFLSHLPPEMDAIFLRCVARLKDRYEKVSLLRKDLRKLESQLHEKSKPNSTRLTQTISQRYKQAKERAMFTIYCAYQALKFSVVALCCAFFLYGLWNLAEISVTEKQPVHSVSIKSGNTTQDVQSSSVQKGIQKPALVRLVEYLWKKVFQLVRAVKKWFSVGGSFSAFSFSFGSGKF